MPMQEPFERLHLEQNRSSDCPTSLRRLPYSPLCLPHSHIMATDVPIHREPLPTVSDVKEWTEEKLFGFILSQNILRNDNDRMAFKNAEFTGEQFLTVGAVSGFWAAKCHLPLGPSVGLAALPQRIMGAGEEPWLGNAFLCLPDAAGSI